jgi:anti-sigma factor RsiW
MTPTWHDNDNGIPEEELQAHVDGELDGRRRAAIEAYLATNGAEAARVAAYRAQNIGLHALFDPARHSDDSAVPPRITELARQLDAQLHGDMAPSRRGKILRGKLLHDRRAIAASLALLLTAGTSGWLALQQSGWNDAPLVTLTRQATSDQPGSATPLQLASTTSQGGAEAQAGSAPEGARQVVTWLAAQPGKAPTRLPDLEALDFELVAERVITTSGGQPAAQLLYQDGKGQRVTLYMRAGGKAGKASFTFTREGEAAQFFWQDSHMAYSLVGKMAQDQLLRIAETVNKSLQDAAEEPAAPEPATPAPLEPAAQPEAGKPAAALPTVPLNDGTLAPETSLPLPEPGEEAPKET